jgi:ABC-type branched-subunit amino acid transport system permease subunit
MTGVRVDVRTWIQPRAALAAAVLLALALLPQIAGFVDNPFLIRVGMRIMILAIAALSLNLILGYGGMVSLGHAAFIGVAAYVVAILNWHLGNDEPLLSWPILVQGSANALVVAPAAIAASSLSALVIGFISLRTSGLYFIMITLAFAQMLYYVFIALQKYGGEDGTQLLEPIKLGPLGLNNRVLLYYIVFAVLIGVLLLVDRIVGSRFGRVLQGCRQNERRLEAVGFSTFHYKLVAFVMAGAIAGIAGVLLALSQQFVSPADLAWSRSGELVIMLVLGGVSTLFGPVFGSAFYVILELVLGSWTTHWQIVFGPVFIFFVLFVKGGIAGMLDAPYRWRAGDG